MKKSWKPRLGFAVCGGLFIAAIYSLIVCFTDDERFPASEFSGLAVARMFLAGGLLTVIIDLLVSSTDEDDKGDRDDDDPPSPKRSPLRTGTRSRGGSHFEKV